MRLWAYYALHTFWNAIRKMFRSTFIIVMAAIVGIGIIFGFAAGTIATVLEKQESDIAVEEREGYGDSEYGYFDEEEGFLFYDDLYEEGLGGYDEDENFIYYEDAIEQELGYYDAHGEFVFYFEEITEEDMVYIRLVAEAVAFVLVLILLGFGIYSGTKRGSDIFVMADVNFLFTAPMKPQSVLMFRLSFQMLAIFAGTLYLLFQIPNLVLNAGIPLETCLLIFGAIIIVLAIQRLFSVGTYTIAATHEKVQRFVLPGLIGIVLILTAAIGVTFLATGRDVWRTLELTFSSPWTRLLPFVGWTKGMVIHSINGNLAMVLLYLALNLIGMAVLVYGIWQIKADFYEDAMGGAQQREDALLAASENRKPVSVNADGTKKKDKRKVKEAHASVFGKASGAQMFFMKELLVRRRMAKFGFATVTMLWYLTICVGMAVLNLKIFETTDFTVTGVILMTVVFFRNYGNPIAQETSMNWLFLVPESAYRKVFYAMMAGTYATFMNLLPGMIIAMLLLKMNPLTTLLWLVTLVTMDFMLSGVGMLLEGLFPATALDVVKATLQLMLKFGMILFIVIAFVAGILLDGIELALVLNLIMNIVIGAVTFMIYPSMLHGGIE